MKIKKFNEGNENQILLQTKSDLQKMKSAKSVEKSIKQSIESWMNSYFNQKIKKFLEEVKKGSKYEEMPDDFKEVYKLIGDDFQRVPNEIANKYGENIKIARSLMIEYLEEFAQPTTVIGRREFKNK